MADGEVMQAPTGATPPSLEHVRGLNLPYRGIVDHGVEGSDPNPDDEIHHYDNARPVVYDVSEAEKEPDPVPVYVVRGKEKREVRSFSTAQMPVNVGQAQQICGRNILRSSLKIRNIVGSAGIVYVGDSNVSNMSGYPLAAGEELSLTTTEPVYVFTLTALVVVSVFWEYTREYE